MAQGEPAGPAPQSPEAERAITPGPAVTRSAAFDAASRRAIVAEIAAAMRNDYVELEVGARAAAKIEQALAAGDYDDLQTPATFAVRLTAELAAVTHDKQLAVIAPGEPPPPGAPAEPLNESGVVRADRLPGDVGYIEITGFPPPDDFKGALDRAMAALAGTRALIIDMRGNGGGDPKGVAYLVSFFVTAKPPVQVMDILWRTPDTTPFRSDPTVTSVVPTSFAGKPVYVLTSSQTFSGGEEFCYDMQAMKLAVLVGQTTSGVATPGMPRPLGAGLSLFLPSMKALSPVTGANWQGVGVTPDVPAPADQALKVALERLGQAPRSGDVSVLSEASLFKLRATPLPGTEAALRRMIESNARGQPDYDELTPALADLVRAHVAEVQTMLAGMGPIQSVTFRGPWHAHGDSFEVRFAKGAQIWTLSLTPEGKVTGAAFGPDPLPTNSVAGAG
jgi:hypothetical protein